jgi:uncharacterized membrane protein
LFNSGKCPTENTFKEIGMGKKTIISVLVLFLMTPLMAGCSRDLVGGAVLGGAGVGAAYEYQNKRQMDMLEEDFRTGRINKEEYLKRKDQISKGSIIY